VIYSIEPFIQTFLFDKLGDESMALEGIKFDHYRILQLVGRGGMGEVYLAEDIQIHRQVAVKVIRIETVQFDQQTMTNTLRSFWHEATAIAKLDHPAILPLYDYGETTLDGSHIAYLIIPYRPEKSLIHWLIQRAQAPHTQQLKLKQVVHIIQQAGQALQYAHDHQIMHLDVKPANFLIRSRSATDEYPDLLLSDFGVARLGSTTSSTSQHVRGSPTYMAPEQCVSRPEFASDQYALAIMAYELLTGSPPFSGPPMNVMFAHLQEQPKPVRDGNPILPMAVDLVLQRAFAKKPEARFPSVSAFAQAFQEAFRSMPEESVLRILSSSPFIPTPRLSGTSSVGDITATLTISLQEAQNGTIRTLNLTNGRTVRVQIPPGAQSGQVLTLIGQGQPLGSSSTAGNLYITLSVIEAQMQISPTASNDASTYHRSSPAQSSIHLPLRTDKPLQGDNASTEVKNPFITPNPVTPPPRMPISGANYPNPVTPPPRMPISGANYPNPVTPPPRMPISGANYPDPVTPPPSMPISGANYPVPNHLYNETVANTSYGNAGPAQSKSIFSRRSLLLLGIAALTLAGGGIAATFAATYYNVHNPSTAGSSSPKQTRTPTAPPTSVAETPTPTPTEIPFSGSWSALPSLRYPTADNAAIHVRLQQRDYIYMTGGYRGRNYSPRNDDTLYRYDIAASRWDIAESNFPGMFNNVIVQDKQQNLYFTAGYSPDSNIVVTLLYKYQPSTGTIQQISPHSQQIVFGYGGSMIIDQQGYLYLTQGFMQPIYSYTSAGTGWYRYNTTLDQWDVLASLPAGVAYAVLGFDSQGNIVLMGGATDTEQSNGTSGIYRYNVAQNVWTDTQKRTPQPFNGAANCTVGNGQVVVVGGYDPANNVTLSNAWLIDLNTLNAQPLASLPGGGARLGTACNVAGHIYLTRGILQNADLPTADFLYL
jgi:serine/threonine protein kinase